MSPQERDQLSLFLKHLTEARVIGEKDAEAESLIREAVGRQPDAAYLLIQRTMLVEQALNAAKTQISQLQSQLQASQSGNRASGFLGGGNPWGQSLEGGSAAPQAVPGAGNYQIPRAAPAANAPAFGAGGGAGGFLGNIATTAAGVVAGSFLFQGIENLLGHHQSPLSSWGDSGREYVTEETVINNYYESPADRDLANNDNGSQADASGDFLGSDDSDSFLDDSDDSGWA